MKEGIEWIDGMDWMDFKRSRRSNVVATQGRGMGGYNLLVIGQCKTCRKLISKSNLAQADRSLVQMGVGVVYGVWCVVCGVWAWAWARVWVWVWVWVYMRERVSVSVSVCVLRVCVCVT